MVWAFPRLNEQHSAVFGNGESHMLAEPAQPGGVESPKREVFWPIEPDQSARHSLSNGHAAGPEAGQYGLHVRLFLAVAPLRHGVVLSQRLARSGGIESRQAVLFPLLRVGGVPGAEVFALRLQRAPRPDIGLPATRRRRAARFSCADSSDAKW